MKMKKTIYILLVVGLATFLNACVDDYQDANPPRLKDSPAVSSVTVANELLKSGESTKITAVVVDAPAGVDSVGVEALDEDDEPVGTYTVDTPLTGQTKGDIEITFTAPTGVSSAITITVTVYDKQFDEDGEVVRKNSVPQDVEVNVICGVLAGPHSVKGEFLVDDFGSPTVTKDQVVLSVDCNNNYLLEDITGGLYTTTYADNYDTDPAEAEIFLDSETNLITWSDVSDQFGGDVIQDPDQPASSYNPATKTFVIYWTATSYGERGVATFTMK